MLKILAILITLTSVANAGAACDKLAADVQTCNNLDINRVVSCIRQIEKDNNCRLLEGKNAEATAVAPAFDAYIQKRIEIHKQLYGN